MQAIQTRYLGPTNYKGARIKATCQRGSITVSYPYELSGDACHIFAADKLVEKFAAEDRIKYGPGESSWLAPRVCGQLPSGDYAHVFKGGAI